MNDLKVQLTLPLEGLRYILPTCIANVDISEQYTYTSRMDNVAIERAWCANSLLQEIAQLKRFILMRNCSKFFLKFFLSYFVKHDLNGDWKDTFYNNISHDKEKMDLVHFIRPHM